MSPSSPNLPEELASLIDIDGMATRLKIRKESVRRLIHRGQLKVWEFGRSFYIRPVELETFAENYCNHHDRRQARMPLAA